MTARRRPQQGFTLVELVVSVAMAGIVFAIVMGVVLMQQRAQESTEVMRSAISSGRNAIIEIDHALRRAGFGIEPAHAFDFNFFRCASSDLVDGLCRDRREAPDVLSFVSRDPNYQIVPLSTDPCTDPDGCPEMCTDPNGCLQGRVWRMTSYDASGPKIMLTAREGQIFRKGQTLLAVCRSSSNYTMMTVKDTVLAADDGDIELTLNAAVSGNPYFANALAPPCFSNQPIVYAVERHHYFIHEYDGVPWLVLDTGLDLDGDDNDPWTNPDEKDFIPIAPNVEDLQVAYVLSRTAPGVMPDSDANGVVGDDAEDGAAAEEPNNTLAAPNYQTPSDSPLRRNLHPANIRGVRYTVTVRSERPDPGGVPGWLGDPLPQPENSSRELDDAALGRFRRQEASSYVNVRNLESRGMYSL